MISPERFGPFGRVQRYLSLVDLTTSHRGGQDTREMPPQTALKNPGESDVHVGEKQRGEIVVAPEGGRVVEITAPNKQVYRMGLSVRDQRVLFALLNRTETDEEFYSVLREFAEKRSPTVEGGFHDYETDRWEPGALTRPTLTMRDRIDDDDLHTPRVPYEKMLMMRRGVKGPNRYRRKKRRSREREMDKKTKIKVAGLLNAAAKEICGYSLSASTIGEFKPLAVKTLKLLDKIEEAVEEGAHPSQKDKALKVIEYTRKVYKKAASNEEAFEVFSAFSGIEDFGLDNEEEKVEQLRHFVSGKKGIEGRKGYVLSNILSKKNAASLLKYALWGSSLEDTSTEWNKDFGKPPL